ncbi:hypothetical protein Tco_0994166 [Tanacetum coccineum]
MSEQTISLISDVVNQEVGTAALPPPPSDAKNRAFAETPGEAYVFKKLKGTSETSSGKAPVLVLSIVSPPTSAAAAKVREFVITSALAKRLKSAVKGTDEFAVGSSHDTVGLHDDSTSIEAGFEHLCSSMEITKATTFMSSESTHSQLLVYARSLSLSSHAPRHILGILLNMVEDSAKMPRHDRFYASMSVDPANMAATRHITLFIEIRLRLEHYERMKEKLERRVKCRDAAILETEVKDLRKEADRCRLSPSLSIVMPVFEARLTGKLWLNNSLTAEKLSYLQVLLVMGTEEAKEDKVRTLVNPASGSTSSTGGGVDQFIITPSIPYAEDDGALTI